VCAPLHWSSDGVICKYEPNFSCQDAPSPVCGCDGRTYASRCLAEKAALKRITDGACP
jgi:hypothetical protein